MPNSNRLACRTADIHNNKHIMAITERILNAKKRRVGLTQNYTIHSGRMTASRKQTVWSSGGTYCTVLLLSFG